MIHQRQRLSLRLETGDDGILEVKYTETEHYQFTKDFLNRHERMLQLLISAEDEDLESKRRKS